MGWLIMVRATFLATANGSGKQKQGSSLNPEKQPAALSPSTTFIAGLHRKMHLLTLDGNPLAGPVLVIPPQWGASAHTQHAVLQLEVQRVEAQELHPQLAHFRLTAALCKHQRNLGTCTHG